MRQFNKYTGSESSEKNSQNFTSKNLSTKYFIVALIITIALGIISLFTGVFDIFGENGKEMFFITRIPRTIALMLSGTAMAISGLVMQLITQNKFVEPTTTGTSEWAGLGLLFTYIFFPAPTMIQRMIGAIVFSFFGTMIFFGFLRKIRLKSSLMVPIIGIMLGAVVSAISTFLSLMFAKTQSIEAWFQGSFSPVQRGRYEFLWLIIIFTILIYLYAEKITIAGLGKEVSTNLGVNYNRVILVGTALVSISVGLVSAVIGNLPFLGLIVPNIISMVRGDKLKENLPWVAVLGMSIITFCDIIARAIIKPFELPVSLILGTFGAIIFIYMLLGKKTAGER